VHRSFSKFAIIGAAFVMLVGITVLITGQPASQNAVGVPDDWSHHHLVFSNPGTAADALAQGRFEQWYRIVNDPRYIMQQMKRNPIQRALGPAPDFATLAARLSAPVGDWWPIRKPPPPTPRNPRALKEDWNVSLGAGGTVGAGNYPAKFTFIGAASCSDFIIFNTSLAGAGGQATVIAFNNLYSTGTSPCTSVPSVAWAYNTTTNDKVVTSVVPSWTGDQVAFISTDGTHAYLNVLRFEAAEGTLYSSPVSPDFTVSTSGSAYSNCKTTNPGKSCLLRLEFANSANDLTSSPFYDYNGDNVWVGDAGGGVHEFTGVFRGTSTVESGTAPSPWATAGVVALTSPVYDGSTYVYVGSKNGLMYHINSTPTVVASGTLATGTGIADAPLVDPAGYVYVTVGADGSGDWGAYKLAAGFASGYSTWAEVGGISGSTSVPAYAGTLDNVYYQTGPTNGTLFVCTPYSGGLRFARIPISEFPSSGTSTASYYDTASGTAGTPCSPLTENLSGGSDWIFFSVANHPNWTSGTTCSSSTSCLYNFNIGTGTGTASLPSTPTDGFGVNDQTSGTVSGTSGIVVDNSTTSGTVTGANIYFTPIVSGTTPCSSSTMGCGVQVSQSAP
jgi:hypothetical protein